MECIIFLENTKFHECVRSAWILVCKWSPGSAFGVRTFQQKKMWECVGVRRSALKDSRVRLECALLTHCYALQTHFSTARELVLFNAIMPPLSCSFSYLFLRTKLPNSKRIVLVPKGYIINEITLNFLNKITNGCSSERHHSHKTCFQTT